MRRTDEESSLDGTLTSSHATTFTAYNPRTGDGRGTHFADATPAEVDRAVDAAAEALDDFKGLTAAKLAIFLRAVAVQAQRSATKLIETAEGETGLDADRLTIELTRACAQFTSFAELVELGDHFEAVIESGSDGTSPSPDLRRMQIPIGPVGVFAASNFPFAFGVLGGDVASALAARCPVVVKGHPSHPETSTKSASILIEAALRCGLPQGAIALLQGMDTNVGQALVTSRNLRAVGFTGSLQGGRALYQLATQRPEPIPVYAEMGSLNPVFVTAGTLSSRPEEFARGFVSSMMLSNGQFCTKPGLLFVPTTHARKLLGLLTQIIRRLEPQPMLNHRMADTFHRQVASTTRIPGIHTEEIDRLQTKTGFQVDPVLISVDSRLYFGTQALAEEHFGPFGAVITCDTGAEMQTSAEMMSGSLTATIHCQPEEEAQMSGLANALQNRVGRLIWNGFPTGVTVSPAMHHGGPYPAATFSGHTSVGTYAIRRWLRPVCFQSFPDALLPAALQDANPLRLARLVNSEWTRRPVSRHGRT